MLHLVLFNRLDDVDDADDARPFVFSKRCGSPLQAAQNSWDELWNPSWVETDGAARLYGSDSDLPSGKHTKNNGKSQVLMGKSTTVFMAIFNSKLLVYQRVEPVLLH